MYGNICIKRGVSSPPPRIEEQSYNIEKSILADKQTKKSISSWCWFLNPLPALTYQNVLDLNVACQAKRTQNVLART
jgi:hypothetical protein